MYSGNSEGYVLDKSQLFRLLDVLRDYGELIGPVHDGKWLRMQKFEAQEDLCFEGISWYSSKKFVFPQKHTVFYFDGAKIVSDKVLDRKVLFGLRMCDLNSFMINDKLFLEQNPSNEVYKGLRDGLTLVGLWCDKEQDHFCFCDSFELKHFYDVCLFDRGDYWHVKTGSKKGEEIVAKLSFEDDKREVYEKELPDCHLKLASMDLERFFDRDDVWQQGADKCLSCGDCTSLCPTCLCFDVKDEVNIDLKSGKRIVEWDSCMFHDFSLVAGNHAFRAPRVSRLKHRVYHKVVYFPKKFDGQTMCTGCGRCIRGCPTKIHWVAMANGLIHQEERENGGGSEK